MEREILWSSDISNLSANYTAQLWDSGNLVLQENGRTVWESFAYPTDSFVNNMRISAASVTDQKRRLSSWKSPSDPSPGDFSFGVEVLQTAQLLIWNRSNKVCWRSGPWNGNMFIGIPIINSVYNTGFELVSGSNSMLNNISAYFSLRYSNELGQFYYQLTSEGILVENVWDERKKDWDATSTLKTTCRVYGKCGPFGIGICNSQDSSICTCLKGFEPRDKEEWDKGNWTGGFTRKKSLDFCTNSRASRDGYVKVKEMKVPDFPQWRSISPDNCDTMCLENCSCSAYAYYQGVGCMHWTDNLIDIQQLQQAGADLYIRVARSELGMLESLKSVYILVVLLPCR